MKEAIVAISTCFGVSSIGVLRISGKDSFNIINKIFKAYSNEKSVKNAKGYTSLYGEIVDEKEIIDDVVLHFFKSPKSYTGEDIVEVSCHGSTYILKKVLYLILKNGARLAEPGEFTKRAVLNGKMSLTQAEAINDILYSQTSVSSKLARNLKNGALFKKTNEIKEDILNLLQHICAYIDYPEEDIKESTKTEIEEKINYNIKEIKKLIDSFDYGEILKGGVTTSIIGKTNVGKSSLMNTISKTEKSIVTNIKGTTRDVVEAQIQLQNVILNLFDTAGIRETEDVVESIGTKKSIEMIKSSDLLLVVFDSSCDLDEDDKKIINLCKNINNKIAVLNKADKKSNIDLEKIKKHFVHIVNISASKQIGIENLENKIEEVLKINFKDGFEEIVINERQKDVLVRGLCFLEESFKSININENLDIVMHKLELFLNCIMELTGEILTEEVLDGVFSKFCVGK